MASADADRATRASSVVVLDRHELVVLKRSRPTRRTVRLAQIPIAGGRAAPFSRPAPPTGRDRTGVPSWRVGATAGTATPAGAVSGEGKRGVHHHRPPTNGARVGGGGAKIVTGPRSRRDLCVRRVDTFCAGTRSDARWGGGAGPGRAAEGRSSSLAAVRGPPRTALDRSRRAPRTHCQVRAANGGQRLTIMAKHSTTSGSDGQRGTPHPWWKKESTAGCKADGDPVVTTQQPHQAASPHSPSRGAHVAQKQKWSGHPGSRPA